MSMSIETKNKLQEILRGYNSIVLTALGFFIVNFFTAANKKFDRLDDVVVRQAVMEEIQRVQGLKINTTELDIRQINTNIEEIRMEVNSD